MYDYVVVGAGISGSIAARCFAEQGQKVLVVERRNHIASNLYIYRILENGVSTFLYPISNSDGIVVLEQECIIEHGSHD